VNDVEQWCAKVKNKRGELMAKGQWKRWWTVSVIGAPMGGDDEWAISIHFIESAASKRRQRHATD